MEEAASRHYFERGSKEAIERNRWAFTAVMSSVVSAFLLVALIAMILTQKVHVFQADKDSNGMIQMREASTSFKADEDTQMAWANMWVSTLTEVSPALWQRNVKLVQSKSVGVALDQVRAYLQDPSNNPAQLVHRYPTYVREYKRISVNKVANMTYLVRYELVSRPAPGVATSTRAYAMTITLTHIGHKTRDDVFSNPEGLAVLNFSISEEAR